MGNLGTFSLLTTEKKALAVDSQSHIYMLGIGHFLVRWIKLHVYVQNQLVGKLEPDPKSLLTIASFSTVHTFH